MKLVKSFSKAAFDTRGEVTASYLSLVGTVALGGIVALSGLGTSFREAVSGETRGTVSGGTPAIAVQASVLASVARRVSGMEAEARAVLKVVEPRLTKPEWNGASGVRNPRKGVLLKGRVGAGKTTLVDTIADQLGVVYVRRRAADLVAPQDPIATQANVRQLFEEARQSGVPTLLFIDDYSANRVAQRAVDPDFFIDALKEAMDAIGPNERVAAILGMSEDALRGDERLFRGNRFGVEVNVNTTGQDAFRQLLDTQVEKMNVAGDVDVDRLARILAHSDRDIPAATAEDVEELVRAAGESARDRQMDLAQLDESLAPAPFIVRVPSEKFDDLPVPDFTNPQDIADTLEWYFKRFALPEGFRATIEMFRGGEGATPAQLIPTLENQHLDLMLKIQDDALPTRKALAETRANAERAIQESRGTIEVTIDDFEAGLRRIGRTTNLRDPESTTALKKLEVPGQYL